MCFGRSTTKREKLLDAKATIRVSTVKLQLDEEIRFEAEKNVKRTRDKTDKAKAKMYEENY